jgi:DNA-binding transcriptional regulator YiaG
MANADSTAAQRALDPMGSLFAPIDQPYSLSSNLEVAGDFRQDPVVFGEKQPLVFAQSRDRVGIRSVKRRHSVNDNDNDNGSQSKKVTVVLKLRNALGMSQIEFAQLVGKGYSSIRNYERGVPPPDDVAEKLVQLAVEHGMADLALQLKGEFGVRRVLEPGETLISTARKPKAKAAAPSASSVAPGADRDRLHAMLDEVLDSGDPAAVSAVVSNIQVSTGFIRLRGVTGRKGA